MKRILFIIDSLTCGGAEKSLVSLLPLLDRSKYEVTLWIRHRGGVFESLLTADTHLVDAPRYSFAEKLLLKSGTEGAATSDYGRNLMREMMLVYDGDQKRYAQIAGHGFRILAEAMEKNLPYALKCPALLICGTQDHAGSCIRYNKAWHRNTEIPLMWIKGAGHNSNTDKPEQVNSLIEELVANIL